MSLLASCYYPNWSRSCRLACTRRGGGMSGSSREASGEDVSTPESLQPGPCPLNDAHNVYGGQKTQRLGTFWLFPGPGYLAPSHFSLFVLSGALPYQVDARSVCNTSSPTYSIHDCVGCHTRVLVVGTGFHPHPLPVPWMQPMEMAQRWRHITREVFTRKYTAVNITALQP